MGRSRGTSEKHLTAEEINALSASVILPAELKGRVSVDCGLLFNSFASKSSALSKEAIREFTWILRPLIQTSPAQPLASPSLFAVTSNLLSGLDVPEGKLWLLTYDLRYLRKVWRQCVYRKKHGDWPQWVVTDEEVLDLMQTMERSADEDCKIWGL
ncbi:unnamed protein product, partial [Effrenium voratum]